MAGCPQKPEDRRICGQQLVPFQELQQRPGGLRAVIRKACRRGAQAADQPDHLFPLLELFFPLPPVLKFQFLPNSPDRLLHFFLQDRILNALQEFPRVVHARCPGIPVERPVQILFAVALPQHRAGLAQFFYVFQPPLFHAFVQIRFFSRPLAKLDCGQRVDVQAALDIGNGIVLQARHKHFALLASGFVGQFIQPLNNRSDHRGLAGSRRALDDRDIRRIQRDVNGFCLPQGRVIAEHLFRHPGRQRCHTFVPCGGTIGDPLDDTGDVRVCRFSVQDQVPALFPAFDLPCIAVNGQADHAAVQRFRPWVILAL